MSRVRPRRAVEPPASAPGRVARVVGNVVLTVAAVAGALCVVLVLAAVVFKISLTMFATGSMAPTIPAGSVAVIRDVPVSAVKVGDVVTVQRPGKLPVTHRIRSISPGPGDSRLLVLRGDANAQDDPEPYQVTRVGIVLFSVPGLAPVIVAMSRPVVLGVITIVAAALVGWAFWPRRRAGTAAAMVALLVLLPVIGALVGPAPPASAATSERVISGKVITLVSIGDDTAMAALRPGVRVLWQVGVLSDPPDPGQISVSLAASGPLAEHTDGLQLSVRSCTQRWVGDTCPGTARVVRSDEPAMSFRTAPDIVDFPAGETHWLLLSVWLPTGSAATGTAQLTLAAAGEGDAVATVPVRPSLPNTGAPEARPVLVAGALTILLGVVALAVPRRRRGAP